MCIAMLIEGLSSKLGSCCACNAAQPRCSSPEELVTIVGSLPGCASAWPDRADASMHHVDASTAQHNMFTVHIGAIEGMLHSSEGSRTDRHGDPFWALPAPPWPHTPSGFSPALQRGPHPSGSLCCPQGQSQWRCTGSTLWCHRWGSTGPPHCRLGPGICQHHTTGLGRHTSRMSWSRSTCSSQMH